MDQNEIRHFLESFLPKRERTIVIVDFANVEKWKNSLGWPIGIRELGGLVKNFTHGQRFLRRFYYGADYGPDEKSTILVSWSEYILRTAETNGFEVIKKRVKYIHSQDNVHGYEKKCDLDVEMAIDLVRERDNYDDIVLFSGDGDLMTAIDYLHTNYQKCATVMSARGHIGREVLDAKQSGIVNEIIFADDFEYRLNMNRFRRR